MPGESPTPGVAFPEKAGLDRDGRIPVIALGASAGGLDALEAFFRAMPRRPGVACVVLQHLDPHQQSLLPGILSRNATMPVREVTTPTPLARDTVYCLAPGTSLRLGEGMLIPETAHCDERRLARPIDLFFRSLAGAIGRDAVAVVLSGALSDGTMGILAVKEGGGLVMAQDPETAGCRSMPESALATGLVDLTLSPADMPAAILEFLGQEEAQAELAVPGDESLDELTRLLAGRTGQDFSWYRRSTLRRRIRRRLRLLGLDGIEAYSRLLAEDVGEAKALVNDLLIGVTAFFRERAVWEEFRSAVIPRLLAETDPARTLRVWVPACSTGEEAYTVAMLFNEAVRQKPRSIQIFATDLDERTLDKARAAWYPENIADDVPPDLLTRYFQADAGGYRVAKELRDLILFACHNVLSDPPFSRTDCISCRNLLIYLEPGMQRHVLSRFHFSLRDGGVLILGSAESPGRCTHWFAPLYKKHKIYRRIGGTAPHREWSLAAPSGFRREGGPPPDATAPEDLSRKAERFLLEHFVPASVVVNKSQEILFFHGPTERYLDHPKGKAVYDLAGMAKEGVRIKLRAAVRGVFESGDSQADPLGPVTVTLREDGQARRIRFMVRRMPGPSDDASLAMVVFEEAEAADPAMPCDPLQEASAALSARLEMELESTRDEMQGLVEELEASNEELTASNEEMMSMNEELRSTNEELQAAKEEQQALNEEVSTVNARLQAKVAELEAANNDLGNLMASTDIATLFLDTRLRIRRFTPAAMRLFGLIAGDEGRPVADLSLRLSDPTLPQDAEEVVESLAPHHKEVQAESGEWYLRRILPFRTQDRRVEGLVVTYADVTNLKQFARQLERHKTELEILVRERTQELCESEERFRQLVENLREAFWMRDVTTGVMLYVSPPFEDLFGLPLDAEFKRPYGFLDRVHPKDRTVVEAAVAEQRRSLTPLSVEFRLQRPDGVIRWIWSRSSVVKDAVGTPLRIVGFSEDITERKDAEEAIRASRNHIQNILESTTDAFFEVDRDFTFTYVNRKAEIPLRMSREALLGRNLWEAFPETVGTVIYSELQRAFEDMRPVELEAPYPPFDAWWEMHAFPTPASLSVYFRDVTDRKRREEDLHKAKEAAEAGSRAKNEFLANMSHEIRTPLNGVLGMLQLLQTTALTPEQAGYAETAIGSGQSLMTILGDILDLSKIEAGMLQLFREPFDPGDVAASVHGMFLDQAMAKGLALRCETDANVPAQLLGDPTRLRQVLFNLVGNAIKFTEKGAVSTSISLIRTNAETESADVLFTVSDTGIGVADDKLDAIFHPFTQSDGSFTRRHHGTGLGLSIVKRLVGLMHGSLDMESELGQGTTVYMALRFPISQACRVPARRRAMLPAGLSLRVLLVEDDAVNRIAAGRLLEKLGHTVAQAANGAEAIAALERESFDIVFMDIQMPVLDGMEATQRIRASGRPFADIPIVALTAHAMKGDREKFLSGGLDDYVSKPVDLVALEAVIEGLRRPHQIISQS